MYAAVKEANVPTLADYLQEYLTRPDVMERMKQLQTTCDNLHEAISGFFKQFDGVVQEFCKQFDAAFQRAADSSPSPGYEPLLIERGATLIFARMTASLLVRHGNRRAMESVRLPAVVVAVRFLTHPRRNRRAILQRVEVLLTAWEETSVIETIFHDAGLNEFEFIGLLKTFAEGHEVAGRLTEIAVSLVPHLPSRRGPKISAASAAHEFLLGHIVPEFGGGAYTWNEFERRFTDPVTEATRREFKSCHFDPRPACRRLKARQTKN